MTTLKSVAMGLGLMLGSLHGWSAAEDAKFDVSGLWDFQTDVANQKGAPQFTFKLDGNKLSGKYSGQFGDADLTGSIDGDKIEFRFATQSGMATYKGTLIDKDQMKGDADYGPENRGTWTGARNSGQPTTAQLEAERRVKELAIALNSGEFAAFKKFMSEHFSPQMQNVPEERHEQFFRQVYDKSKGLEFASIQERRANQIIALFKQSSDGGWLAMRVAVQPDLPHLITGLGNAPPKPPVSPPAAK